MSAKKPDRRVQTAVFHSSCFRSVRLDVLGLQRAGRLLQRGGRLVVTLFGMILVIGFFGEWLGKLLKINPPS